MSERERLEADDARFAELMPRAGARPEVAVPALAVERVRAAVREAWAHKVAARRRRRRLFSLGAAAAVVLALVAGAWTLLQRDGAPAGVPIARVEWSGGGATLVSGAIVETGRRLETGGDGLLALRTDSGHSIRVAPDSSVRFVSARRLEVDRGAVYVDSGPDRGHAAIDVDTPQGRVSELGTRFEVRVGDDALRVRVRDGRVALTSEAGRHEAAAGSELSVDDTGSVARRAIPVYGDEWAWVLDAARAPAIDGRPLSELLDWIARETGWEVEYADDVLAERAPRIVLRGSVEGLSPEQSLEAILPTCGLSYSVRAGRLLLEESAGAGVQ